MEARVALLDTDVYVSSEWKFLIEVIVGSGQYHWSHTWTRVLYCPYSEGPLTHICPMAFYIQLCGETVTYISE